MSDSSQRKRWVLSLDESWTGSVSSLQLLPDGGFVVRDMYTQTLGIFQRDPMTREWRSGEIRTRETWTSIVCIVPLNEQTIVAGMNDGQTVVYHREDADWEWVQFANHDKNWFSKQIGGSVFTHLFHLTEWQFVGITKASRFVVCEVVPLRSFDIRILQCIPLYTKSTLTSWFQSEDNEIIIGMHNMVIIMVRSPSGAWSVKQEHAFGQRRKAVKIFPGKGFILVDWARRNAFLHSADREEFWQRDESGQYAKVDYTMSDMDAVLRVSSDQDDMLAFENGWTPVPSTFQNHIFPKHIELDRLFAYAIISSGSLYFGNSEFGQKERCHPRLRFSGALSDGCLLQINGQHGLHVWEDTLQARCHDFAALMSIFSILV